MRERGKTGILVLLLSAALAATSVLALAAVASAAGDGFVSRPVPINSGRLFDLGVADYDQDGRQELFSTNHRFLGTFIESNLAGGWTNLMGSTGFSPTPEYPGFEDLLHAPTIDRPGLYIYATGSGESVDPEKNPTIHIVANDITGIPLLPESAKGELTLLSPAVQVVRKDGAQVSVHKSPGRRLVVDFSVAEQGDIALKVVHADLPPFSFQISQAPLLARTYIGANKVPATSSRFNLRLIDRHGIAWTDANRDGTVDAFVVRGGLGGGIVDYVGEVNDELLIANSKGNFSNKYQGSGLVKGACRSRLTTSVDYDGDGLLDLFSSCKHSTPKLYRALPSGQFGSRSKALARVPSQGTYYRWIDLLGDRRPELIVAAKEQVTVLESSGVRRWRVAEQVHAFNGTKLVYSITPGDFDRDGDSDLFVGANSGNTLLVNHDGNLHAVRPAAVGLPGHGSGASWVDFDNDGRLDLHSVPTGLYRQGHDGHFEQTGFVRNRLDSVWGIADWLDIDNDGYRDVATAVRRPGGGADVDARLDLNTRSGHRWLEVDLAGPPGNPQGVGARVRVKTGRRVQTGFVGEADGARFSHGHYRLYYGLNKSAIADRVTVKWSDGKTTVLRHVHADRRLVIHH
jgi:hypothetical protein